MKNIILASASPRRAELLKLLKLEFDVIPSYIDETINEKLNTQDTVKKLAYEKAADIANRAGIKGLVIGADTVVVKNDILGKPKNFEDALEMLMKLQGHWHEVLTGIAVMNTLTRKTVIEYELTRVKMKQLSEETIRSYIRTGEPMDKAGAYGIQGLGSILIERIEGCYFNVVGLPLQKLSLVLEDFGVKVL